MTERSKRIFWITIPIFCVFLALAANNAIFHRETSCLDKPAEQIDIVLDKTKPYTLIQKVRSIEPYFKEAISSARANAQILVFQISDDPTHPKEIWAGCRPDTDVSPLNGDPHMAAAKLAAVMADVRAQVDSIVLVYPRAPIAESLDVIGSEAQITGPEEAGVHVKFLIVSDMIQESPLPDSASKSFGISLWGCTEPISSESDDIKRLQRMYRDIDVEVVALRRTRRVQKPLPSDKCMMSFWQNIFQHLTWDPAL